MWSVDRLLRTIRIVVFNFGYFKLKHPATLNSHVEVLSPDFLRITLRRPNYIHWVPGQCAYLTIPGLSTLGAHPFTISNIDVPLTSKKFTEKQLSDESLDHFHKSKQMSFLVRVHKGFTQHMRSAARDKESLNILFDGPYGDPPLLTGFDTVVLIAGRPPLQHQVQRIHEFYQVEPGCLLHFL
jgi:predicted ferric reductase